MIEHKFKSWYFPDKTDFGLAWLCNIIEIFSKNPLIILLEEKYKLGQLYIVLPKSLKCDHKSFK